MRKEMKGGGFNLRRIVLILTTVAVMVAMMIATAVPAFAGSTQVTDFDCNVIDSDLNTKNLDGNDPDVNTHNTATPSGNINMHCHYHPDTNP
jgi:hypothetical protein